VENSLYAGYLWHLRYRHAGIYALFSGEFVCAKRNNEAKNKFPDSVNG
jgi:hypothetical protein